MAVALESFSIREYTAKMRSVDFGKCWPFDGDGDGKREGEMGRSLPPISFRKFRWWFDELEATRSAGEKPDGGAVRGLELERTGALPAEEGRQMRTPVKAKQRAPKKRSIVELFAVSPQIGAVEDEADGCDGVEGKRGAVEDEKREEEVGGEEIGREESLGGGDGGGGTDGRVSSPRKRKEKVKEIQKNKKMAKKSWIKYKSKKKKKLKVDICAAKKEKNFRTKTSYSGDISQLLQDSVCKKRLRKALRDSVDVRKKKPSTVKSLLKKQNCKLIRDSKLLFKKQEAGKVLPIHGILKNHTKSSSVKKSSLIGNTQGGNSFKPSCVSEKHVRFSGKDDILGHSKGFSPLELPQLQSLCKIFSDVLAASSARGELGKGDKLPPPTKGAQVVYDSENDAVASGAEETSGGGKAQLSDANSRAASHEFINPNNETCPDRERSSLGEVVDLNSAIQSSSNSNNIHSGSSGLSASHVYSGKQQVLNSYGKEGSNSDEGIHSDKRTKSNLPAPIESGISSSEIMSSLAMTRNLLSQPSTTCSVMSMETNERQPDLFLGPRIDVDRCVSEIQPMRFITPKNLRSSICTSFGLKGSGETRLVSDQMPICKDKCIDGDFIGLPLNSQGELIKLHSSGKFGLLDLFKHQNTVVGSCHSFPVSDLVESRRNMDHINMRGKFPAAPLYMKDQLRWYPERCSNPASIPVTSGLGIMQLHGFERMEVQNHLAMRDKDQHFHHGPNYMKVSCYGCREHSQQDHNLNNREKFQAEGNLNHGVQPAHQPTMRLMGKNVTVGKSSEDCRNFDDGKIWTDKEIISEHSPSVRLSDTSLPSRWLQQEWFKHPASEASRLFQPLESSSSIYRSPAVEPRFDHMHFDCQEQWISRNGLSSTMRNHGSRMNPCSHPPPQTMPNKIPNRAVNSVTDYVEVGHQIPFMATPQNISQHMLLMSTHCKHSQSFSFSTSSISHPAFLSQNCGNFVESSSVQSSLCQPEWLLNAEQHKNGNKSSFPFCSDPIGIHHPCTTSGSKLPLLPFMYPTSIISFPIYNTSSSHTCGSTPVVHSPFIPVYPASKTTFSGNARFRNKTKHRDRTKSKLTYLKSLDRANKSNKRPAAKDDGFMKPVKKPHLTIQDNSNVPPGPRREQLNVGSSDDAGTPEISALANKIIDVGLPVTSNGKNGLKIPSASSSLNPSSGTRSGPVKLSAGAKHILKPSQNMDEDNSRPIYSTIPFAVGTSCSTAPVSQKSATIYRF
ncbi:uncharacterized protein LOC103717205 [Phoenix dactylifera]|uniref:Uncharacterized protein LOC103717205 n=1 Tax=Phoenix dactylifera TaxID=42345 RepID=A0A8B7CPT5_PHODC|nr:uncharacterized protein LOC103717205 [Phoenix dactylifera]